MSVKEKLKEKHVAIRKRKDEFLDKTLDSLHLTKTMLNLIIMALIIVVVMVILKIVRG